MKTVMACWVWCFSLMWLPGQSDQDLLTNNYVVPPTFLQGPFSHEWQPRDPFADFHPPAPRKTARQILEGAGISFGDGSSAIYNAVTSQLIVRNTQDQMELIEAYIESIQTGVEKQIYLTFREIFIEEEKIESVQDLGFDWLLGSSEDVSEGVPGRHRSLNSYQSFLQELSRPPTIHEEPPSVARRIAGVFTDPQFQLMKRVLDEKSSFKMGSFPSVMVRSGQPGLVQVGERRYGAIAALGVEEFSIDLSIFLPEHGKALFQPGDDLTTPYRVTIWDGQTVALSATMKGQGVRTVFLTAQIMDPAGMPINPAGGSKEAKTSAQESVPSAEMPESTDDLVATAQEPWTASLPQGASYLVKDGDTLYGIATEAHTSVSELKELNRLESDYVEEGQIILIPADGNGLPGLEDMLASTVIPSVNFEDTPLVEALGYIHRVLLTNTGAALFPTPVPKIVIKDLGAHGSIAVTLRLKNVPVKEALRYLTSLAQCQYEVEGTRIVISPLGKPEEN